MERGPSNSQCLLSQELEECRAEAKQSKQLLSAEALVEKSKMVQVPSISSSLKFLKEAYYGDIWSIVMSCLAF